MISLDNTASLVGREAFFFGEFADEDISTSTCKESSEDFSSLPKQEAF